ncbi:MAG TPA: CPBP family intramembrane glutamic endopeptidase [Mucilaginibacter sp.]
MEGIEIINRRYYAIMVLGIVLPLLLSPFLSTNFLSADQSFTYRFVFSRFLIWVVLGLMFLYAHQAEVQRFFLWDEESYDFSFYLISIVSLFVLLIADGILAHIPYTLGLHEKSDMLRKMHLLMNRYPALMVFTCITAGITEELIFRGYMMSRLSLIFTNKTLPVVISAALFSYVHLGYKNLGEIIFSFLFGLIFGYHYQKYRNIKVLIVVHSLWDLMATWPTLHHR